MATRLLSFLLALLVGAGAVGWQAHRRHQMAEALERARADLESSHAALEQSQRALELARRTAKVVTEYVDRVHVVRERGETLIKEIPVYVTADADAACIVPSGFVRLHDAAAQGVKLAGTAGSSDAASSGIALSALAATTVDNYASCHANAAQVIGLQSYIGELLDVLEVREHAP